MSEVSAGGAVRSEAGNATAIGAAHRLSLAAAPTFAIMALLTVLLGGGHTEALCGAGHPALALGGMAPMYLLMSVFHAGPWLILASRRRRGAGRG